MGEKKDCGCNCEEYPFLQFSIIKQALEIIILTEIALCLMAILTIGIV